MLVLVCPLNIWMIRIIVFSLQDWVASEGVGITVEEGLSIADMGCWIQLLKYWAYICS